MIKKIGQHIVLNKIRATQHSTESETKADPMEVKSSPCPNQSLIESLVKRIERLEAKVLPDKNSSRAPNHTKGNSNTALN